MLIIYAMNLIPCLLGVQSYTILNTLKYRESGIGVFLMAPSLEVVIAFCRAPSATNTAIPFVDKSHVDIYPILI
jgi:hypothetical protein